MARNVPEMARLLRVHGSPFLNGDDSFFDRIEEENDRCNQQALLENERRRARVRAEAARMKKDYASMAEALASIGPALTPLERRWLAYARSKGPQPNRRGVH